MTKNVIKNFLKTQAENAKLDRATFRISPRSTNHCWEVRRQSESRDQCHFSAALVTKAMTALIFWRECFELGEAIQIPINLSLFIYLSTVFVLLFLYMSIYLSVYCLNCIFIYLVLVSRGSIKFLFFQANFTFYISKKYAKNSQAIQLSPFGGKLPYTIQLETNTSLQVRTRVEKKYRQKRRTKRRFLSVFVGFIGFACKKRRFLTVFVGFLQIVGFACKKRRFLTVFVGFCQFCRNNRYCCKERRIKFSLSTVLNSLLKSCKKSTRYVVKFRAKKLAI